MRKESRGHITLAVSAALLLGASSARAQEPAAQTPEPEAQTPEQVAQMREPETPESEAPRLPPRLVLSGSTTVVGPFLSPPGPVAHLSLLHRLGGRAALGPTVAFGRTGDDSRGLHRFLSVGAELQWRPLTGSVRPWLGVGPFVSFFRSQELDGSGSTLRMAKRSGGTWGVGVGAGIEYWPSPRWGLTAGGRLLGGISKLPIIEGDDLTRALADYFVGATFAL